MSEFPEKEIEQVNNDEAPSAETPAEGDSETPIAFNTEGSTIFVKHEYNTKKPAQKVGLKRIIICSVAVLLCGAIGASIFLINRFIPTGNESGNTSSTGIAERSFKILSADSLIKESTVEIDGKSVEVESNISLAGFYNHYEQYSVMPCYEAASTDEKETSESSTSSTDKKEYLYDTKWHINGIDRALTLSDELGSHIEKCLNISAIQTMENTFSSVEEYYKYYGIDDPTRVFTVQFNDGTEKVEVIVGQRVATGDANYLTISGDENVYIVKSSYIANLDYLPIHFAQKTMVPQLQKTDANAKYFNDNSQVARFDYISISGNIVKDQKIEFGMSDSPSADMMPYVMTAPYKRPASNDFVAKILEFATSGLDASSVYSFRCTDENRAAAGFDDPNCVIELKVGDYRFKMTVGGIMQEGDTGLSVLIEGKPQIFKMDLDVVGFITGDITEMFNDDFIMEDIYTVKEVSFTDKNGTDNFKLTHKLQSGSDTVYDTFVNLNGAEMETKSFKRIYQRSLLLSLLSYTTEAQKTQVQYAIRFKYVNGYADKVVEFTESPTDMYHYIAWVNGTPLGEVLKSNVVDIFDNLDKYIAGEEIGDVW